MKGLSNGIINDALAYAYRVASIEIYENYEKF